MTAVHACALDRILADPLLQPRVEGVDPGHVRYLESVVEHWPPLKVVPHEGG